MAHEPIESAFPTVAVVPNEDSNTSLFQDGDSNDMQYLVIDIDTGVVIGQVRMVMADQWRYALASRSYPQPKMLDTMSSAVNALLIDVLTGSADE